MSDQANGELIDDIEQRREIENVFDQTVHRSRRPCAVPVASQIERVDVIVLAQRARYPIPVASVIQAAMHQYQSGLSVLAVVPELQFQSVGIEEVRDWFH